MVIIKTEGLTKIFKVGFWGREYRAVDDLSLDVKEGEVFGFLGPNGAGKTTTIKMLMGLIYPTSGMIWLMDEEYNRVDIKSRIGFLPENPFFYEYLTGEEFLHLIGNLFGMKRLERKNKIESLLSLVRLKGVEGRQLRRYSKGMLQRIGIAQALINNPRLVILDEPMSGLDPIGRKEIRDIILKMRDEGKTIFFSTHILSDVEMICERVGILVNGRLVGAGRIDDILREEIERVEVTANRVKGEGIKLIEKIAEKVLYQQDNVMAIIERGEIDRVIDIIRGYNGRLVSIVPQRASLEEIFFKEVKNRSC